MLCPACIFPLKSRLTYLAASLVFPLRCLITISNLTSPKGNPWSPPLFLFYHPSSAQAKTLKSSLTGLSLTPQIWSVSLTFNLCPECNHFSLLPLLPCYLSPQLVQEPPRWEQVAFVGTQRSSTAMAKKHRCISVGAPFCFILFLQWSRKQGHRQRKKMGGEWVFEVCGQRRRSEMSPGTVGE